MRNRETEEFESWLKDRSDQYLMYPSERVWNGIQKEVNPTRWWHYAAVAILVMGITTTSVIIKNEKSSIVKERLGQTTYRILGPEMEQKVLDAVIITGHEKKQLTPPVSKSHGIEKLEGIIPNLNRMTSEALEESDTIEWHSGTIADVPSLQLNSQRQKVLKVEKRNLIASAFENVVSQARKFQQNVKWQFYASPTIGYRQLYGKASGSSYQYSSFSLSTNAMFVTDVNDAVKHDPGMGFEFGTAMYYPLGRRLNLKSGLQANYNHYQIEAYSSIPEIATFGVNNLRVGSVPINTISEYSNMGGYSKAKLRNEHYMISMPIGIDYIVAGNRFFNIAIGSTIQPTYVFTNYSYLISTNLKNYAKEPSLNRRWNVNTSIEASLNIESKGYKWSIAPQYRYQLMSSFKNKYPIKENLTDFGIKLGVMKTINQ